VNLSFLIKLQVEFLHLVPCQKRYDLNYVVYHPTVVVFSGRNCNFLAWQVNLFLPRQSSTFFRFANAQSAAGATENSPARREASAGKETDKLVPPGTADVGVISPLHSLTNRLKLLSSGSMLVIWRECFSGALQLVLI
jgi:hypothetical protein